MKKLLSLLIVALIISCAITLASCKNGGDQTTTTTVTTTKEPIEDAPIHVHTLSEWIIDEESDCQNIGSKHKECLSCGAIIETDIINLSGHNYQLKEEIDATCTQDGYILYACENNGCDSEKEQILPQFGHDFNDNGECLECGYVLPSHNHSYSENIVDATCVSMGYTEYTCSCGHSYRDYYIDFLPHKWNDGVVTTPVTCTSNGVKMYSCDNCDEYYIEIIPCGHDWFDTVTKEATCTENGSVSRECLRCGDEQVEIILASHKWEYLSTEAQATCTLYGCEIHICSVCEKTQEISISALGHNFHNGTCSRCDAGFIDAVKTHPESSKYGMFFELDETISAYGPAKVNEYGIYLDYNKSAKINKVGIYITQHGNMWCRTLAFTGSNIEYGTFVPYLSYSDRIMYSGQNSRWINTFNLKRNSEGIWTYGNYTLVSANLADRNGNLLLALYNIYQAGAETRIFDDLEQMKAWLKEHDHEELKTITVKPTCTKNGYTAKVCGICGDHYDKTNATEQLDHNWSEATCTKLSTCSRCGMTTGLLKDHVESDWIVDKEPTRTEEGSQHTECTVCGSKLNTSGIERIKYSQGLKYTLTNDRTGYSVTGIGTCKDLYIEIPDMYEGLPVTEIGLSAFWQCKSIVSVVMPDTIKLIYPSAFSGCISLGSVVISNSVIAIGNFAFNDCLSLSDVVIPDSIQFICKNAFSGCSALETIEIPSSVVRIDEQAFAECSSLKSINIPDSVTQLGYQAFYNCKSLESVVLGDSLTEIQYQTFYNCSSLKNITLGDCVTDIGYEAFYNNAFESIVLPDTLKNIGKGIFYFCAYLRSVTIPNSVTSLPENTFVGCMNLVEINIGSSVESIGNDIFSGCFYLESVEVDLNNKHYKSIDGNLYAADEKTLIKYAVGKRDRSFVVPSTVTSITEFAFADCWALASIVIPESVVNIGDYTFSYCDSLTIYCEAESQPDGWSEYWNYSNRPVVWGYTGE